MLAHLQAEVQRRLPLLLLLLLVDPPLLLLLLLLVDLLLLMLLPLLPHARGPATETQQGDLATGALRPRDWKW